MCWVCRAGIWALVLLVIALTAEALVASAAVAALAAKAGVEVASMAAFIQGLAGLSVGALTDRICCFISQGTVCCRER